MQDINTSLLARVPTRVKVPLRHPQSSLLTPPMCTPSVHVMQVGDIKSDRLALWMVQQYLERNVLIFDPAELKVGPHVGPHIPLCPASCVDCAAVTC